MEVFMASHTWKGPIRKEGDDEEDGWKGKLVETWLVIEVVNCFHNPPNI